MSKKREICLPVSWHVPLNHGSFETTTLEQGIIDWCVNTGVASQALAQKTVVQLNPFQYMNMLFPKIDLSDSFAMKLYEINASLIVAGYIVDDVLENYTLAALEELDTFFQATEAWVSNFQPMHYPRQGKISELLSEMDVPYSKAVICMFIDYCNQCSNEIWRNNVPFSAVSQFRRRLSASVTAYLHMAIANRQSDAEVDEKEFLWRRSADNLGFPVLMLSEVLSGLLQIECSRIPLVTLHYFHMYSNLFAHVLNDLNSYHRDKHTDHNSLVKLWLKKGIATDIDDAAIKIVQFLNSVTVNMFKAFKKVQLQFPDCLALENFVQYIACTFTGWVLIHTTAVERYKLSPYQTTLAKVETSREESWLKDESEFGKRCVQMFEDLMQEREKEMAFLYGIN